MSTLSRRDVLKIAGAAGVVPLLGAGSRRCRRGSSVICDRVLTSVPDTRPCKLYVKGKGLTFYIYDKGNNLISRPAKDDAYDLDVDYVDDPDMAGNKLCRHPWAPNTSNDTLSSPAKDRDSNIFDYHQFTVTLQGDGGNKHHVQVECLAMYKKASPEKKVIPYSAACCITCGNVEYCIPSGSCIMCGSFKYCCPPT